jgi:hypothetical protein
MIEIKEDDILHLLHKVLKEQVEQGKILQELKYYIKHERNVKTWDIYKFDCAQCGYVFSEKVPWTRCRWTDRWESDECKKSDLLSTICPECCVPRTIRIIDHRTEVKAVVEDETPGIFAYGFELPDEPKETPNETPNSQDNVVVTGSDSPGDSDGDSSASDS